MLTKEKEVVMDVRDPDSISKLINWCWDNLDRTEYQADIISMFPLQYRFKFNCSKTLVMAALNA